MATPTSAQLAIATLYTAAFNRAPDAAGFDFWLQAYQQGASVSRLATTFLGTPEGQATYPVGLSSEGFVAAFYSSVFGRSADDSGLRFWTSALDSLGGAGNASAKAALMVNIISVASTPVTAKPDGLSDAAYAQTVADRARFINKTEFGVYFAAELRSNDLSLAKQMLALVTADPASVSVARSLAAQGGIAATPPVVVPALTSADDVAAITSKLAAYGGTAATADTSSMTAAQLKALAAGASKVNANGLTGSLSLSTAVTASEASTLLAKYAGTTASADATGMDAAYLALLAGATSKFAVGSITTPTLTLANVLLDDVATESLLAKATGAQLVATGATAVELLSIVNHVGNVATGGITGTFALLGSLDATQLTSLLGKLSAAARVTADVSSMQASQLVVLAAKPSSLDAGALTGSLQLSAPLTATAVGVLLDRYAGTDARLVASATVGSDVLNAVAAMSSKVSSISGDLTILSDVNPADGLSLLGKYVGSTASINASVFDSTQLQSLYGSLSKLTTITAPKLVLADAWLTPTAVADLLAKSTDAGVTITGVSGGQFTNLMAQLPKIADNGIVGTLAITNSTAAASGLQTLLQKTAVGATVNVDAASMGLDQIVALFAQAAKIDGVTNLSVPSAAWTQLPADLGVLLGKSTGTQIDLSGASAAQLKLLAPSSSQYAAGGLVGTFALDSSFSAAQLGALLGDRVNGTADVTVNAAGMDVDQVVALFANAANVDHLSNLSAPSGTMAQIGMDFGLLFTKGIGSAVDLTGATAQQLGVIGQFVNQIKADGLTGSFTITKDVNEAYYASLLGDRVADAANVTVQAAGMRDAQLLALATGIGKVDTILGLSLTTANTASLSDSQAASLLSKATGADVTGITDLQFTGMLGLVADGTLKGALSLGLSELQAATVSTLNTKLSTEATLKITGTGGADIIDLTGLSKMADVNGGAGADSITLGSGGGTVFIGGQAESRSADFSLSQATSDKLDRITMNGGDVIVKLSQAPGAFGGSGMTFSSQSVTPLKQWAAPMPVGAFSDFSLVLGGDFGSPSTSAAVSWGVLTLISYPFNNTLEGKYLIIFDDTPGFDINDTIIELLGTSSTFTVTI